MSACLRMLKNLFLLCLFSAILPSIVIGQTLELYPAGKSFNAASRDFETLALDRPIVDNYRINASVNVSNIDVYRPILIRGEKDVHDIEIYLQPQPGKNPNLVVAHNRDNGANFDFVLYPFVIDGEVPLSRNVTITVIYSNPRLRVYFDGSEQVPLPIQTSTNWSDQNNMRLPGSTTDNWLLGTLDHTRFDGAFYFDGSLGALSIADGLLPGSSGQGGGVVYASDANGGREVNCANSGAGQVWDESIAQIELLNTGSFADWMMPSRDQLDVLYQQRFLISAAGCTMNTDMHWSATEVNLDVEGNTAACSIGCNAAWAQNFNNTSGEQRPVLKNDGTFLARAVREYQYDGNNENLYRTITSDAPESRLAVLEFDQASIFVDEGEALSILVNRSGNLSDQVTVRHRIVRDDASAGKKDYEYSSQQLTWAGGDSGPASVAFAASVDDLTEGTEYVTIELFKPSANAILGLNSSIRVAIEDIKVRPLLINTALRGILETVVDTEAPIPVSILLRDPVDLQVGEAGWAQIAEAQREFYRQLKTLPGYDENLQPVSTLTTSPVIFVDLTPVQIDAVSRISNVRQITDLPEMEPDTDSAFDLIYTPEGVVPPFNGQTLADNGYTGAGVLVSVIDYYLDANAAFDDNIIDTFNTAAPAVDGVIPGDVASCTETAPNGEPSHGSMVTALVAGAGGAAPDAGIVFYNKGYCSGTEEINRGTYGTSLALDKIIMELVQDTDLAPDIITISSSLKDYNDEFHDLSNTCDEWAQENYFHMFEVLQSITGTHGVPVFNSTGNDSDKAGTNFSACLSFVTGVGNSADGNYDDPASLTDEIYVTSNTAAHLDLSAPGTKISQRTAFPPFPNTDGPGSLI